MLPVCIAWPRHALDPLVKVKKTDEREPNPKIGQKHQELFRFGMSDVLPPTSAHNSLNIPQSSIPDTRPRIWLEMIQLGGTLIREDWVHDGEADVGAGDRVSQAC